jgi:hypothetical protein
MRKPKLKLITTPVDPTAPPSDLGEAGRALWRAIMDEYQVDDGAGRETLRQICHAADIADAAHQRSMYKEELASRSFIVRALHRLNLDVAPLEARAGRPSGGLYGKATR